eukprot:UN1389
MERLFWPVYDVSPAAKVLILDWRTFTERDASSAKFYWLMMNVHGYCFNLFAGLLGAPWVLAVNGLDRLFGSEMYNFLVQGGPPLAMFTAGNEVIRDLYMAVLRPRRIGSHMFAGLKETVQTREEYDDFYKIPYERIPPERRMSWDMRKHGYEDLCAFLGIKDCPRKGLLPNMPFFFDWEDLYHGEHLTIWLVCSAFHMVNFYVFSVGLTALGALFRIARGSVGGGRRSDQVE